MHDLFFALRPNPLAAEHIAVLTDQLRSRRGLSGRAIERERLHISLNPLGRHHDLPPRLIARASEVASTLALRPFVVALDRVVSFRNNAGRRPLVLMGEDGVIGVLALYSAIHDALADAILVRRPEPVLTPHLTLLRDYRSAPEEFIPPVSWRVQEFVLIHSPYGEGRHEVLGRWPL